MTKIKMLNPIVEMDGDEMTRLMWDMIKTELLQPYIELKTEYYDLGLPSRDESADGVTIAAAKAVERHGVGVKCATITPNRQRMTEYKLHEMWKSPNGTIRAILDGTTFRAPITTSRVRPNVRSWKKPITIARHSYGDIYKGTEYRVPGAGKAELVFTGEDGESYRQTIFDFDGPGVLQGTYNIDSSIESFARSCFEFAINVGQDLWFSAKDTISKQYDGHFREVFEKMYAEYEAKFKEAGLTYFYTLNDDAVARIMRSEGGIVWALKNYDGDLMSDMISSAFGSLAMMTSVLVSPNGQFVYEAAHGTVTRHWRRRQAGERTSTNPVATIFAWTGALRKRGELDSQPELADFAARLEAATMLTIEEGVLPGDLAPLCGEAPCPDTESFIAEIKKRI